MADTPERFSAYVTKYALTQGIEKIEVEVCGKDYPEMVKSIAGMGGHYHNADWHRTWAAAKAQAEKMRENKIASLEKSLEKMRALKFTEPE